MHDDLFSMHIYVRYKSKVFFSNGFRFKVLRVTPNIQIYFSKIVNFLVRKLIYVVILY